MATTTKGLIAKEDVKYWDGSNPTFQRIDSTGGYQTLTPIGNYVDVLQVYGSTLSSRNAATLISAIKSIGSSECPIILSPGTWTIGEDFSIPSNITVKVPRGAILSIDSGITLTINGTIEAGLYQIFSGSGTVTGFDANRIVPEWWGAVQNDLSSASTNATAFQSAAATGKSIRLEPNATYYLNDGFEFSTDRQCLFGNKAKIITTADFDKTSNTFEVVYLNANYCTVYDAVFDCALTATASNNNRIVWTEPGKTNNRVTGCEFYSVPSGAANLQTAIGFGLACSYSKADNNYFSGCPGSVFSQGARTIITKNITLNPKDVSYAVNSTSADACSIIDNKSYNAANTTLSVHIAAEEGASNWIITDNEIYGVKDGAGISALNVAVTTTVRGGKIHNNIVNGGGLTCTSPSALISVSQYYTNAKITNNEMFNPPVGLSTNSALSVPTNGTFVRGNDISGDSGMAGVVLITPSGGRMQIENNKVNGNSAARLFVVNNGDNSGEAISFRNGIYLDATEAINTALNSPTNCPIEIYNPEYETCTSFTNIGATSWGDRSTFFNTYNAYRWPVHISSGRTVMYGNAAPTSGSWQQGDKILNVVPTGGTPTIGWVCVADGSPGTWVAF